MQFKRKLIHQTWENGKKRNFGPNFGQIDLNLGPKYFFMDFTSTSN